MSFRSAGDGAPHCHAGSGGQLSRRGGDGGRATLAKNTTGSAKAQAVTLMPVICTGPEPFTGGMGSCPGPGTAGRGVGPG